MWTVASAFDLAANGVLPGSYPALAPNRGPHTIPSSLLKAVGWVESGWRQYTPAGRPLVSFDFGYGVMQITSGMAGAFGNPAGDIDPAVQARIATDYQYNIAYGAMVLASKWAATPPIGNRDPQVVEDWYYALWAYNGWGWINNPNNPRFTRTGTPATNPSAFPYQERVLYFVSHPPRDAQGNLLWAPVPVTLPAVDAIGRTPGPLILTSTHSQPPAVLAAVYHPQPLLPLRPRSSEHVAVSVRNTGTSAWQTGAAGGVSLVYDVIKGRAQSLDNLSPFAPGVIAFEQGSVALPRAVLPGAWGTVRASVTAPTAPGKYTIVWDLLNGAAGPFSQSGAMPYTEQLLVTSAGVHVTPTPTTTPTPAAPAEGLLYVADTAVPDGTTLDAGQPFVKAWLVYNNGRATWGKGWAVYRISGAQMGSAYFPIPATSPCRSANIVISLRAPKRAGSYRSVWQVEDPSHHRVGERLTIVIAVSESGPAGPTPTPTPPPTGTPGAPPPTATPVG